MMTRCCTPCLASWCGSLLAPLLPGVINKVKAWFAGRRGPPVLQLYFDLAQLWRKGIVLSTAVSPGHIVGSGGGVGRAGRRRRCCCRSDARGAPHRASTAMRCCSSYLLALGALLHGGARAGHRLGVRRHGRGARSELRGAGRSRRSSPRLLALGVQTRSVSLDADARTRGRRRAPALLARGAVHRAARRELPRAVRRSQHAPRADDDSRGDGARPQRSAACGRSCTAPR